MKKNICLIIILVLTAFNLHASHNGKPVIILRSSWQTINIGDIAHSPGALALLEKEYPEAEVRLWAGNVGDGVREMIQLRFPNVEIFTSSDTAAIARAFEQGDFLLHGSGPWLVAPHDVERWIEQTGKPYGVFGISLPEERVDDRIISLLSKSKFIYFRDSPSLELAKRVGIRTAVMEFGPDCAFATDLRNDTAAEKFLQDNDLQHGKFMCVIPKYRRTPNWLIPSKNAPYDKAIDDRNQAMKEHDHEPYRNAIIAIVEKTDMKVLICPEDVTQVALGKEMLYDPLPEQIKKRVVWRNKFWLTDEALSVYVRSAGLFGLEQHSPIMCIDNGIPACVGRYHEQTTKGYMWQDIGLGDWLFDSDTPRDMDKLTRTVLNIAKKNKSAKNRAMNAKKLVDAKMSEMVSVLKMELNKR